MHGKDIALIGAGVAASIFGLKLLRDRLFGTDLEGLDSVVSYSSRKIAGKTASHFSHVAPASHHTTLCAV